MGGGDARHSALDTILDLGKALTALDVPVGVTGQKGGKAFPVVMEQLAPGKILPDSRPDFPQVRVYPQGKAARAVNCAGGGHGPVEVTGIHGINLSVLKPALQQLELRPALLGEQAVVPAVAAAVIIALRLAVADQIDRGHRKSPLFLSDASAPLSLHIACRSAAWYGILNGRGPRVDLGTPFGASKPVSRVLSFKTAIYLGAPLPVRSSRLLNTAGPAFCVPTALLRIEFTAMGA